MNDRHIILIGNYAADKQESMLRFSSFLYRSLKERGISCSLLQPSSRFGKIAPGVRGAGKWLGYLDKFILHPSELVKQVNKQSGPCLVHICDHSNAFYLKHIKETPHLITCHDLIAIKAAQGLFAHQQTRFTGKVLQKMVTQGLMAAKTIACDSIKTQQDLTEVLGIRKENTTHVPLCPFYPYRPMPREEADAKIAKAIPEFSRPPPPFILHVGSDAWYKNRTGVLHIYKSLKILTGSPDRLVFVGPPPSKEMRVHLKNYKIEDCVHFIEATSNDILRALYSRAELLLFPSKEEGFGLPILEALASGCRVLTTDKAPMTEIGGDAAYYIQPLETSNANETAHWAQEGALMVAKLIAEDPESRKASEEQGMLHAQTFNRELTIDRYMKLYQSILTP